MRIVKRYWIEILAFGAVFAVLLMDVAPALTWINTDSDGAHYVLAAKYMLPAHNTSAPLFLLLGRLFLFLPFGAEAWRLGLISVLATTGCTILIYMVVRHYLADNSRGRLYAIIAGLIYGGSALVISQSTIIESYALATMLSVGAYYCALRKKWILASVMIGLIWAVHTIFAWTTWLVLFVTYKELRNVVLVMITLAFLVFYAYIPITTAINGDLGMWNNTTFGGFFGGQWGVLMMLTGGISIWDIPKRIIDTIGILGVSFGLGFIVFVIGLWRIRKTNRALVFLIFIPIVYFVTNLAAQTYVYLMPAIAFGTILIGVTLSRLHISLSYVTLVVAVGLLIFNANYFDIGRTLDPNLSAQKFYDEELPKIKDGDIFMAGGWTWAITYLYNKEEGRDIVPVSIDILPSNEYLGMLEAKGIKLVRTDSDSHIDKQWEVALSIAQNNSNVWIASETIPSQYEYEVVPAEGNEWLMTRWLGHEVVPEISLMPSNPYDFITGAIEVSEWKFILKSNHNARFLFTWAVFGYFVFWLVDRRISARKRGKQHGDIPKIQA
ncbi:hypothetical protein LCGC14_1173760 [marine sediment metagenome]|uniref:Glycosyltransferase RgtA/B/C/D-like domain-containing protein n=1 Tax=marine sediment metagenome TaxID=412755 RepID=A0A0F9PUM2_9ZZZZ